MPPQRPLRRGACGYASDRFPNPTMPKQDLLEQVDGLLGKKDDRKLRSVLARHSPDDIASVINKLENGKRKTFAMLPPEVQADVVLRLSENSKTFVLPRTSDHTIARFLHFNEEDDAADILQFLPEERRMVVLNWVKPDKKAKIEKLLTFHPETAGGLMDLNFLKVRSTMTLRDVGAKAREYVKEHRQTPTVIVTDATGKVMGFVPPKSLMLASTDKPVSDLMQPLPVIDHSTDQEKIVRMATRERGDVFGVVDDQDKFLGIVHLKDLLKVAQMEATEDLLKFAGVSPEEELLGPARTAIRMRYKWLLVNLGTAFIASFVVSQFENTIALLPILAVYMPIVAGMGGNAGTQALAVAVRGLAVGEVPQRQRVRLLIKEVLTGLANGTINGIVVAGVITLFSGRADIGLLLGASMVINMVVAGVAGALIPITLKAFKVDPAVASAVFVTTATDVFGFLTFLGLATLFLL